MSMTNLKAKDSLLKGFEFCESEQYDDALKAFEASARARPEAAEIHYGLGLLYLLLGDKNSAEKEQKILKSLNVNLGKKLMSFISESG